jgi:hypothetical protein
MARRVAADTGLKIDFGHRPKPASFAKLNWTLTAVAARIKRTETAARIAPVIHLPERRERDPRPRGRRTRRAGTSRDGPSRLAEDESEPPPLAAPLLGGAA